MQLLSQTYLNKKIPTYIYKEKSLYEKYGTKLKELRLKNNVTLKDLAESLDTTTNTLREIESGNGRDRFYFYYIYCRHFNLSSYKYLDYSLLPINTFNDKIILLKAYTGLKSNIELDTKLGLYKGALYDVCANKVSVNKYSRIENILTKNLLEIQKEVGTP